MRLIILVFVTYYKHESIEGDEICTADGALGQKTNTQGGFVKKNFGKKRELCVLERRSDDNIKFFFFK